MSKYIHYPNLGLLFLRIFLGVNVLMHGISKITGGISGVKGILAAKGIPEFIGYGVYVGEVAAPVMIILGIFTRLGSLILLGACAVILYVAHADKLFSITSYGGLAPEIVYLYIGSAICLLLNGGGKFVVRAD